MKIITPFFLGLLLALFFSCTKTIRKQLDENVINQLKII
jgi:hypothetical protein